MVLMSSLSGAVRRGFSRVKSTSKLPTSLADFYKHESRIVKFLSGFKLNQKMIFFSINKIKSEFPVSGFSLVLSGLP